jgi:hypothetical protein
MLDPLNKAKPKSLSQKKAMTKLKQMSETGRGLC